MTQPLFALFLVSGDTMPNPTKIVFLNGPPHSGKDFIANRLMERIDREYTTATHKLSLARGMREVAMNFLGLEDTDDSYALAKSTTQPLLARFKRMGIGESLQNDNLREFMIAFSESFIKPRYGQDFWMRYLLHRNPWLGKSPSIVFIPDLGFWDEYNFACEWFGEESVYTIQLHRPGTSFANDSRGYVQMHRGISITNTNELLTANLTILLDELDFNGWLSTKR